MLHAAEDSWTTPRAQMLLWAVPFCAAFSARPTLLPASRARSHSVRLPAVVSAADSSARATAREVEECVAEAKTPAELDACADVAERGLFTLELQGDGWDDVRQKIIDAKKDRQKPWEALQNDKTVKTASKVAKVARIVAEEVVDATPALPNAEAIQAQGGGLKGIALASLDLAAERAQAEKAKRTAVAEAAAAAAAAEKKKEGAKDGLLAGTNVTLLLCTLLAGPALALLVGLGDL